MAKVMIHHSVTEARVIVMVEEAYSTTDNMGICLKCGDECDGVEPDARRYICYSCGAKLVFGAEEILLNGYYHRRARPTA